MSSVLVPMADGPPSPDRPPPLRALPGARPTDAALIAASVGNHEQFAVLFDRHAAAVHRYLGRRVGELADDLLSETFLIAFRRRAAYRADHVEVRPWLLGIATNVVHGHARSERRRYRALARSAPEPATPAGAEEVHARVDAGALRGPLAAALAGLEERDRDVLLLVQLLREVGPEGPALTTQARNAARAALLAEIDGARPRALRLPGRRVRRRVGIGAVAVAASWAAAVVIAAPDEPGPLPDSVELVAFEPLTFPLSLDPVPAGWSEPRFDGDLGFLRISYADDDGEHAASVLVDEEEPEFSDVSAEEEVDVDGTGGTLVTTTSNHHCGTGPDGRDVCELRDEVRLVFQRRDDQWVTVTGPVETERLVGIAGSLVDRPQRVPLHVSLAPAGWSVLAFKDDRILTLVDGQHEQHSLSVHVPSPEDVTPPEQLRASVMGPLGPQLDVTVNGRPAQLVRVDRGMVVEGERVEGWYLQASFPDGTTFVVQAPGSFTRDQVLRTAEAVVHDP